MCFFCKTGEKIGKVIGGLAAQAAKAGAPGQPQKSGAAKPTMVKERVWCYW